jgi:hypothetical protein
MKNQSEIVHNFNEYSTQLEQLFTTGGIRRENRESLEGWLLKIANFDFSNSPKFKTKCDGYVSTIKILLEMKTVRELHDKSHAIDKWALIASSFSAIAALVALIYSIFRGH